MCLTNSWCFAARDFGLPLGASDEHTLQGSVRSEQRRGRPKELRPEGLRRKWPGASLLLGHRSLRICSLVAPRPRPFWAQRNTSQLRDTTLGTDTFGLGFRFVGFGVVVTGVISVLIIVIGVVIGILALEVNVVQ